MNLMLIGSVVLGFLAVALLVQLGLSFWSSYQSTEAKRLRTRMRSLKHMDGEAVTERAQELSDQRVQGWAAQRLADTPLGSGLQLLLRQQTRYFWTVPGLLFRMLLAGVVAAAVLVTMDVLAGGWFVSLMVGLVGGGYIPLAMVLHARSQRLEKVEKQLPDSIDFIERAMRAGHSFSSSIQMAGEETPEPLAREFRIVFEQINYGIPMDEALKSLAQRLPNPHVNYFVVSVLIQRDTGGNLTELLRHVSHSVRERVKFSGELRILSSEGRLSGVVLTGLPFALGGFLYLSNPRFLNGLINDPSGPTVLGTTAALMVVGVLWMRRIVRIDY
jgi:tight adherence protein B